MIALPLVWPVMPLPAWGGFLAALALLRTLWSLAVEVVPEVRRRHATSVAVWAVLAAALFYWASRQNQETWQLVVGQMPLTATNTIALLAVACLGVLLVRAAQGSAKLGSRVGAAVIHLVLLCGAFVFCVPFAWLLVTSVKEDIDMTNANGLVWIPRVKRTAPYFDPENPYYTASYQGAKVEANVERKLPNGHVLLNVSKPLSLSGSLFEADPTSLQEIPRQVDVVSGNLDGQIVVGKVIKAMPNGSVRIEILEPDSLKGQAADMPADQTERVRPIGGRWQNYSEALDMLPPEANKGITYLANSLLLALLSVVGTVVSCLLVAYAFARLRFPGRDALFTLMLSTMMLPAAVTLLPQFLIFRSLGWIDTLLPLWVPAFFATPLYVFMLRQFLRQVPLELEDAAKIDGCSYLKTLVSVLVPQIRPAIIVIAILAFLGAWNNFMGPLIYINSPENMPVAYALQLFNGERSGEPGLLMAFATMGMAPVLLLFALAQKYFVDGVALTGLGGR